MHTNLNFLHINMENTYTWRLWLTQASQYFKQKFDTDLKQPMLAFKLVRYFNPVKAYEIKPSCSDIDDLKLFSFIDSSTIKVNCPNIWQHQRMLVLLLTSFSGGKDMQMSSPSGLMFAK